MADDKVLCETPTPGKKGTRIPKWKYDAVRRAILRAVPRTGSGLPFKALSAAVAANLEPEERRRLGSVTWHTVTVKLDLEVRGEIERVPDVSPQHLRRV